MILENRNQQHFKIFPEFGQFCRFAWKRFSNLFGQKHPYFYTGISVHLLSSRAPLSSANLFMGWWQYLIRECHHGHHRPSRGNETIQKSCEWILSNFAGNPTLQATFIIFGNSRTTAPKSPSLTKINSSITLPVRPAHFNYNETIQLTTFLSTVWFTKWQRISWTAVAVLS